MPITNEEFQMMQNRVNQGRKGTISKPQHGLGTILTPETTKDAAGPKNALDGFQMPEKELQRKVADLLRLKGITFLSPVFGRKTRIKTGWPDLTFAIKGQACAWEMKVGYNEPSEEQNLTMMAMTKDGWHVAVIRNLEQAFEFLKQHGVN